MLVGSRDDARRFFFDVWQQLKAGAPLVGVAHVVADILQMHPEYHDMLDAGPGVITRDFGGAEPVHNPFLHLGLHVALAEQLQADRPPGVLAVHATLLARGEPVHDIAHRMIDCLATELWRAQSTGGLPDEQAYLDSLRRL